MKIQEQIPHWNNFSVPELKEILEHCMALERLGIAQDNEMMASIQRDIALREKIAKIKNQIKPNKSNRTTGKPTKHRQSSIILLEQNT
jgi:hypothetical protein